MSLISYNVSLFLWCSCWCYHAHLPVHLILCAKSWHFTCPSTWYFCNYTMHILQNILADVPLWFSKSKALGLSAIAHKTGATTRTSSSDDASYINTPSFSSTSKSSTTGSANFKQSTVLDAQMKWIFSSWLLTLSVNQQETLPIIISNLFHFWTHSHWHHQRTKLSESSLHGALLMLSSNCSSSSVCPISLKIKRLNVYRQLTVVEIGIAVKSFGSINLYPACACAARG